MVASALMSAAAFFQATDLSDRATDLANQARFAAAQEAQARSALQAKIAHDQQVVIKCAAGVARRNSALLEYSRSFDSSLVPAMIEGERARVGLSALLLADSPASCHTYDIDRALEWASAVARDRGAVSSAALLAQSVDQAHGEPMALAAAVLFAVALLLLTLADSTARSGIAWTWVGLAGFAFVGAVGLTVAADSRVEGISGLAVMTPILIVCVLYVSAWTFVRLRFDSPPPQSSGGSARKLRRFARLRTLRERKVGWYAEILGAVTLVVFALAALGYSESSDHERRSLADVDRLAHDARQILDVGERSAMTALAYVSELSQIDASMAATVARNTRGPGPNADARKAVLARWEDEKASWARMVEQGELSVRDSSCAESGQLLAWEQADHRSGVPLPEALLEAQVSDSGALWQILEVSATAATRCEVRALLRSEEAGEWGRRATRFTVALVALGLAGFLFALAADPDRTLGPKRWLLCSAAVGLGLGALLAVRATVSLPSGADPAHVDAGSDAYAKGAIATLIGDCGAARSSAAVALDKITEFPRAHVLAAQAETCVDRDWLIAPALSDDARTRFLAGLDYAFAHGLQDVGVTGDLGWAHVLTGLEEEGADRATHLERGVDLTQRALKEAMDNPFLCFNLALATSASGDDDLARQRYRIAVEGLHQPPSDTSARCRPGYTDRTLVDYLTLSALADLELVPNSATAEWARNLLVSGTDRTSAADAPILPARMSLTLLPAGVGLESPTDVDGDFSIVWYYRESGDQPWAVLLGPSLATLRPGSYENFSWGLAEVLPPGEVRADLYAGGQRLRSITSDAGWWVGRSVQAVDFERVAIGALGIDLVVPKDWTMSRPAPGVEVVLEGKDKDWHVALRREEAVDRRNLDQRLSTWSKRWIDAWQVGAIDQSGTADTTYLPGLDDVVVRTGGPGAMAGLGHTQYLMASEDGVGQPTDAKHETCPGTAVATVVSAEDPHVAATIWSSLALSSSVHTVESTNVDLRSPFASELFRLQFPREWQGMACPGSLLAVSPDASENVLVSVTEDPRSLPEVLDEYRAELGKLPGFVKEYEGAFAFSNDVPGLEIRFVWQPEDVAPVRQLQMYAVAGGRTYVLTVTKYADAEYNDADLRLIRRTFKPGGSG